MGNYYTAITGMGVYTPIGKNVAEVKSALINGVDGIKQIKRFATDEFSAKYAAMFEPDDWTKLGNAFPELDQRIALALLTAREAISSSQLQNYKLERIGLVLGICLGKMSVDDGFKHANENLEDNSPLLVAKLQHQTHQLAERLNIKGPALTISTACASSNHALGYAQDLLKHGYLDAVVVGGTGELTQHMFAGFYALRNMSDAPCAPFSLPVGLNLGEGAGCLVLEKQPVDGTNNGSVLGSIAGFGTGTDAYHPTSPDPRGSGVSRAIAAALKDTDIGLEDIGYINVHGTGTLENDQSEWLGIKDVFTEQSQNIPVSSSKSFMGHTGGAAGIVETIITLISMNAGFVPTTMHFARPRRLIPKWVVSTTKPQPHTYHAALNCNSGFGGTNAALIVSKELRGAWQPASIKGIPILGTGSVSTYGFNALDQVLLEKKPRQKPTNLNTDGFEIPESAAYVTIDDFSTFTSHRDERFLDPLTRYMITACSLALQDSGLNGGANLSELTGIITGVSHIPSLSLLEFRNSINERGLRGISSHAFSRVVMNASMGAVCESMTIKGPSNTIAAAEGAGLFAAVQACIQLTEDPELKVMYAVAADELGDVPLAMHKLLGRTTIPTEGAGCVLLGQRTQSSENVQIAGAGIAGAADLHTAINQALRSNTIADIPVICTDDGKPVTQEYQLKTLGDIWGGDLDNIITINPATCMGFADASTSMFALIIAVEALRKGKLRTGPSGEYKPVSKILIIHVNPINGSCALLLEKCL